MSRRNKAMGGIHLFSPILVLLLQPVAADDLPSAQAVPDAVQVAPLDAEQAGDTPPSPALILPKGHPIVITVDAEIGSKISQSGEVFPIRLAQPVMVDGVEVLPAGIVGQGQVVHAKKGGMAGSAGELVLAARYLDLGGRRIALRSFKFIEEGDEILSRGKDNVGLASATNAVIGPLGFFIGGGNTIVVPGTIATAKIRDDEAFDGAVAVPGIADGSN